MGSRRGGTPKATAEPIEMAEIVAELVATVEREGAVPRAAVTRRAPRKQLLVILDALVGAGLELGAKFVRRPLDAQLQERLVGPPVALRGLDKVVRGASPGEITRAATSLVERGRARFVARGKDLLLARKDAPILDARARLRLKAVVRELAASLARRPTPLHDGGFSPGRSGIRSTRFRIRGGAFSGHPLRTGDSDAHGSASR